MGRLTDDTGVATERHHRLGKGKAALAREGGERGWRMGRERTETAETESGAVHVRSKLQPPSCT